MRAGGGRLCYFLSRSPGMPPEPLQGRAVAIGSGAAGLECDEPP
jgi:hypothetical protein